MLDAFTQRNFVTKFIRFKLIFIHKNDKFAFWSTLWRSYSNIRTSSIARLKARGRLSIRDNLTFLASSHGWDVISRYWSISALFRQRSLWPLILDGRRCRPHTNVGVRKIKCFRYLTIKIAWSYLHSSRYSTSTRSTDRQTDRQNCHR